MNRKRKLDKVSTSETSTELGFTEEKVQAMKYLAHKIAQSFSQKEDKAEGKEVKTFYQVELEEERRLKLQEKEKLKSLTAPELVKLNRMKALKKEDDQFSKIDNCKVASFDEALNFAEKTADLYHKLNCGKIHVSKRRSASSDSDSVSAEVNRNRHKNYHVENSDKEVESSRSDSQNKFDNAVGSSGKMNLDCVAMTLHDKKKSYKKHKHKRKDKDKKLTVDTSGKIDGIQVEGLVKCEIKKTTRKNASPCENECNQNNFVLKHLFSKSGVSGAIEHETVVGTEGKKKSLKVRTEADIRAHKSLEALRKSRLNSWKW